MGSIQEARIAGFLCRLCSEIHRIVIHIYGEEGLKNNLAKKINGYLPVKIMPNDKLPKTVCKTCIICVQRHHELMEEIIHSNNVYAAFQSRIAAANTVATNSNIPETATASNVVSETSTSNEIADDVSNEDNSTINS